MLSEKAVMEIADGAVCDIARRLSGVELTQAPSSLLSSNEGHSLVIHTKRGYSLTVVLHASNTFLLSAAGRMKRETVSTFEEAAVYVKEFFNILCGHIVSAINNKVHSRTIFDMPEIFLGAYQEPAFPPDSAACALNYYTANGPLSLRLYFDENV